MRTWERVLCLKSHGSSKTIESMKKCFTVENKIWKVMKALSVQSMIAVAFCSLAFSHNNFAQILEKRVTISLSDASVEEALEAIERLTNVKFFYSLDQLRIHEKISIQAFDRSLGDILHQVF